MTKTAVLENIKGVLAQARDTCPNPSIRELIESFYEFIDLYGKRNQVKSNRKEFNEKLQDSYRILYQLFEKTAEEHKLDSSVLQQWLVDPAYISENQWDAVEHFEKMKQEIKSKKLNKRIGQQV